MIVLVDTSVWIRFLSNRAPDAAEVDRLLSRDEVSGHEFVYGELLIGDVGGRKQLLNDYEQMHQAQSCLTTTSLHSCRAETCTGAVLGG
jgi:predicted nucleic acid-binding protein